MIDIIQDFLYWFIDDFLNGIFESAWAIVKFGVALVVAILLLPLWILPFIYWLIAERRKH